MGKKTLLVAALINKLRAVQGWGPLSIDDAKAAARIWLQQFERYGITPAQYNQLADAAIDRRVRGFRANDHHVPPLALELVIAVSELSIGPTPRDAADIAIERTRETIARLISQGEDIDVIEMFEHRLRCLEGGRDANG